VAVLSHRQELLGEPHYEVEERRAGRLEAGSEALGRVRLVHL